MCWGQKSIILNISRNESFLKKSNFKSISNNSEKMFYFKESENVKVTRDIKKFVFNFEKNRENYLFLIFPKNFEECKYALNIIKY